MDVLDVLQVTGEWDVADPANIQGPIERFVGVYRCLLSLSAD